MKNLKIEEHQNKDQLWNEYQKASHSKRRLAIFSYRSHLHFGGWQWLVTMIAKSRGFLCSGLGDSLRLLISAGECIGDSPKKRKSHSLKRKNQLSLRIEVKKIVVSQLHRGSCTVVGAVFFCTTPYSKLKKRGIVFLLISGRIEEHPILKIKLKIITTHQKKENRQCSVFK